jgi:hypothetical protein
MSRRAGGPSGPTAPHAAPRAILDRRAERRFDDGHSLVRQIDIEAVDP